MIRLILLTTFVTLTAGLQGQQAVLVTGQNFTTYNFKDSSGQSDLTLNPQAGSFYEVAADLELFSRGSGLYYSPSVVLNQFNAVGGNRVSLYAWKTNFLGLRQALKFNLLENLDRFDLSVKGGASLNYMVHGVQNINGNVFNLKKDKEFNGLWIQPFAAADFLYYPVADFGVGIGYQFSKVFRLNSDAQALNFTNHQIQFMLLVKNL